MIQLDIFHSIQEQLKKDKRISGIMLMGSVAQGIALPESDLDIMVLGNENYFKTELIDGILVEFIFTEYNSRLQKLLNNDMEVYHFLNSKIMYDIDSKLSSLMSTAIDKYNKFKTSEEIKNQIHHWLMSTKIKLLSAVNSNNILHQNFIISTNSWKVIEAVWAVNDKPVPPSSSVMRFCNHLELIPYPNWIESLFTGTDELKSDAMMKIIEWVLPELRNP